MRLRPSVIAASLSVAALLLSGCVANAPAGSGNIAVNATDTTCQVTPSSAASGSIAFDVTNNGTQVTEFYLLAEDGLRVIGEVEDVAPAATRTLTATLEPGTYVTLCKPGMSGEGVGRGTFTVTGN